VPTAATQLWYWLLSVPVISVLPSSSRNEVKTRLKAPTALKVRSINTLFHKHDTTTNKKFAPHELQSNLTVHGLLCVDFRTTSTAPPAVGVLAVTEQVNVKVKLSLYLTKYQAMKTYWGSEDIAPRTINRGIRWRWVVSFTSRPPYRFGKSPHWPLDRRLGWSQSRSGRGGGPCPCRESNPDRRSRSQVIILTELRCPRHCRM
jgi:hypothetical protein